MFQESSDRTNNQLELGEWLQQEELIPENKGDIQALVWPGNLVVAHSLEKTSEIDRTLACGPNTYDIFYEDLPNTKGINRLTHNLSAQFDTENMFDIEYGWALNSDITRDYKDSLEDHKNGLERIAANSNKILREGSTAVYNLEDIGNSMANPVAERFESTSTGEKVYAEMFQDVLEDYFEEVTIYTDHDFEYSNTHVVGQNLEECSDL